MFPEQSSLWYAQVEIYIVQNAYMDLFWHKNNGKKKQTKLYNRYLQAQKKDTQNKGDESALSKIEKFAQLENGITTQTKSAFQKVKKRKANITLEPPKGYKTYVLDPAKQQICHFPDTDLIEKHMVTTDKLTLELQKERSKYLPCFWIPNLTPDAGKSKINKPTGKIFCPYGKRLKLKKLTPVRFTPRPLTSKELESEEKKEKYQTIYMCPMSLRTLTNSTDCYVVKRTGDVISKQCATIIKEDGIYNGKPIKPSGLIKLNVGGTGFAARGAHTAKAVVLPAYQC